MKFTLLLALAISGTAYAENIPKIDLNNFVGNYKAEKCTIENKINVYIDPSFDAAITRNNSGIDFQTEGKLFRYLRFDGLMEFKNVDKGENSYRDDEGGLCKISDECKSTTDSVSCRHKVSGLLCRNYTKRTIDYSLKFLELKDYKKLIFSIKANRDIESMVCEYSRK